ncbi:MAG: hypothetical protein M0Z30_10775 [Actinomycetota bacterium]|nr:hypothetical protein [Actinomycetota bacterium]
MSSLTDWLVIASPDDEPQLIELAFWIAHEPARTDERTDAPRGGLEPLAGGIGPEWGITKTAGSVVWGGVTNHVDTHDVLAHVAATSWQQPESLQVMVRDEGDSWFRLHMLDGRQLVAHGTRSRRRVAAKPGLRIQWMPVCRCCRRSAATGSECRPGWSDQEARAAGHRRAETTLVSQDRAMESATTIDSRFDVPLYTPTEAARAVGVPSTTFATWANGYTRRSAGRIARGAPVIAAFPSSGHGQPTIPFVGLAEGMVLAAVRRAVVPLQRIRPALEVLVSELGVGHALASRRLYTDGAEILFDYVESAKAADAGLVRQLVVVRNQQRVLADVLDRYLERIDYAPDGYARMIRLPGYHRAEAVVDPERSFGQPVFARGAARVSDVLQRFWAGDDLATLSDEFGVSTVELEDALRVASRRAA